MSGHVMEFQKYSIHGVAFFRALADKPELQSEPFLVNRKAGFPDEAALVSATREARFPFLGKSKSRSRSISWAGRRSTRC